jgi:colanic acid/amylovoran biosynthesis glycosyltransferase
MNFPFAVITPQLGLPSETFIKRHAYDLMPGKTVVVTNNVVSPKGSWTTTAPLLTLANLGRPAFPRRLRDSLLCPLGASPWTPDIAVEDFLRKHKVQAILSEYLDLSLHWLQLANRLAIRFYAHGHGYDVSSSLRSATLRKRYREFNNADGIIVVSDKSRQQLIQLGLNPSLIHVIPCGVDISLEPPKHLPNNVIRCLAIGRMVAKKAPIILLDAFRQATLHCQNLHLDYVGDGPLFDAALQYVTVMNLTEKVTLHRSQEHTLVQSMLRKSDIFLQHSRVDPDTGDEEGLPVAILEAMANCLPVISTRHAGIPEAVCHGVNGYLEAEGDSLAMAKRIIQLARNAALRKQFGESGWQRCQEYFSWECEKKNLRELMQI